MTKTYYGAVAVMESTKSLSNVMEKINKRTKMSLEGAFQSSHENKNDKKPKVRNASKNAIEKKRL